MRSLLLLTAALFVCGALACKRGGDSAAERERALRKTIIGSEAGGKPIMGQFALKPADAAKVHAAQRTSSKAAFELASSLAVKKWVYEDRWCDDAVRQIVFLMLGDEKALAMSAEQLKSAHLAAILERHHLLYQERTPEACERALRRMHEAKSFAKKEGLRHLHFGY